MKRNSKPTQCERVIQYMRDFGSITSAQAMMDLGVYRLAARISELKSAGWEIERRMIPDTNRYGEPVHFAEYRLAVYDESKGVAV